MIISIEASEEALRKAEGTEYHIDLSLEQALELDNIMSGVFAPLETFCGKDDYHSVMDKMRLANGKMWPVPIVLPIPYDIYHLCQSCFVPFVLRHDGEDLAILSSPEAFALDWEKEAETVFGTKSLDHPSVKKISERSPYAISGKITPLKRFVQKDYADYQLDPAETRQLFRDNGWKTVVGFQTRNPIHRAHEYMQKASLETVDGLFINPLAGPQKADDIPSDVRLETYDAIITSYYKHSAVELAIYPSPMYYGGPREAVLHTIVRRNYGCTHFIVGRDHAGVGGFYGAFDAQNLVDEHAKEIGITPIKIDMVFYCKACESMTSNKTCGHGSEDHFFISGTKLREMLSTGEPIPMEISRPEVVKILRKYYEGE